MRIIYLTWGETPRSSGVYGSQVLSQIEAIDQNKDIDIWLITGVPIIHSGLTREKFKYKNEKKIISSKVRKNRYIKVPIFITQNFLLNPWFFTAYHLISNKILQKKICNIKPDIVHCRSYHAAYAAIKARDYLGLNFRIIFDARGLWPEQYSVIHNSGMPNRGYYKLKYIEKCILRKSDCIVSVSETMTNHYEYLGIPKNKLHTIFTSCPVADVVKKKIARNMDSEGYKFCYLGALDEATWHKPSVLSDLFKKILDVSPNSTLKIITKSSHKAASKYFSQKELSKIAFTSTSNAIELREALSDIDIGILSYFIPNTDIEVLFGKTVIAIKTGEYLSEGIPVLINSYCGGAADYVEKHSIGKSYDPKEMSEISKELFHSLTRQEILTNSIEYSRKSFSFASNSDKYLNLYLNECNENE